MKKTIFIGLIFCSVQAFAGRHIMQGDNAGGDLGGTYPNPTVSTSLSGYIQNTNSLQAGTTFFVSSGSVRGSLFTIDADSVSQIETSVTSLPLNDGFGPQLAYPFIRGKINIDSGVPGCFFLEGSTHSSSGLTTSNQSQIALCPSADGFGDISFQANENSSHTIFMNSTGININAEGRMTFFDADSGYVSLQASTTIASSISFVLPNQDGIARDVLHTGGNGDLYFASETARSIFKSTFTSTNLDDYKIYSSSGAISANTSVTITIPGTTSIWFPMVSELEGVNTPGVSVRIKSISTASYVIYNADVANNKNYITWVYAK